MVGMVSLWIALSVCSSPLVLGLHRPPRPYHPTYQRHSAASSMAMVPHLHRNPHLALLVQPPLDEQQPTASLVPAPSVASVEHVKTSRSSGRRVVVS